MAHPLFSRLPSCVSRLLFGALFLCSSSLAAQGVPTGIQEYFVLGYEQHVWDMMDKVENGQGGGPFANGMNSLVTAVASADNQVIYYDHWEDGLEADIFNPVQASTLVIGDGNAANGDACDFNSDACGPDILTQGGFVNFDSRGGILAGCTIPSATPGTFTELCSSVPINPRCAAAACTSAEIRFDGGDYLLTTGGPLSLVHSQDPLTQFIGGSTEVISLQAVEAARSYSVPIGEDLYVANTATEPFHYVDLNLVAFNDNTQVFVDSPGAGTASFTLNQGEHWSSLGFIDDGAFDPTLFLVINAGTKVSTTSAVAGMMFTGGDGQWATRHYTLLPDILHSTDYVITAPGDDPAVTGSTPNRPAVLYIFNPDPVNPVNVTTTDSVGSTTGVVPPNSVVDYNTFAGRFIPNGSTVRLTSDRNFWGVSGYDYNTNISDWGHSWLASKFLSTNYTVSFAPGTLNPPVDMVNLSAVFVAATADNTRVQVDFDNDGTFDVIDLDGDGIPDAAPLPGNTYLVNALGSLRIFDPNDFDNTGTRIVANKPVAVSYGQDTDLTDFGDTALDTGFTVYPTDQLFLQSVLVVDKTVANPVVPIAGGVATYTVEIQTFDFFPLVNLEAWDLLPPGVVGTDYVPGSTLITYPNLTQSTADPVASIDPGTGRDRLDWALSPDTMGISQTLTIQYSVNIPAAPGGTPRVLVNEAHGYGELGFSIFSPFDSAQVIQTDLVLTKSAVTSDATPEPGDTITYTLSIDNNGIAAETNTFITDPIPPNTTFVPGSITDSGPFAGSGVYSPGQNAVVWNAANFPVGGPHLLSFQVTINPGVPANTTILNVGTYESFETPLFPSNEVETVTVGPELVINKTATASVLHPLEISTFEITVENTGTGTANSVVLDDEFPTNATYVSESMRWRLNTDPFVSVTDANDPPDEGEELVDRLRLSVPTLGPGEDLTFRFDYQVDPGTAGLFVNNQANVRSTEIPPTDSNLVQIPIVGDAIITGHVFLDLDGDGTQDPGEPDLPNVDVVIVDFQGNPQTVSTDANGDYTVVVEPGAATADVDETDPDFPTGATLTTANDPQGVVAVSGVSTPTTPVGYEPQPLSFVKSSDGVLPGVVPGETITYTLEVTNSSGITQTGVTVTDALPTGTLAVPGSTVVTLNNPTFRVTEYFVAPGSFGGTVFDLTLDQDLVSDYYALVQGSAAIGNSGGNDTAPENAYARLVQDPFGTGDLGVSASNVVRIQRSDNTDNWSGVVTIVECLSSCSTAGFVLRSVEDVDHTGATESGNTTSATAWTDINQVLLMGGFNGAGCLSAETTDRDHPVCHARLFPSGTDTINWTRDGSNGSVNLTDATSTVMVVEWGSEWTVQRVNVTGSNGGDGLNAIGEYNTAAISSVNRDNTFVWGSGHANGNGIGNQGEAVVITLGDGVNQNASESLVAVGTELGATVDFEVWTLTHPSLTVDYRFKPKGDTAALIVDQTVDTAGTARMALVTNGLSSTSDNYPRPLFSARYLDDSTVRLERRRAGFFGFTAWVQGVDFSSIGGGTPFAGGDPSNLVTLGDAVSLAPNGTMTVTFQVTVDPSLAPGITDIFNEATIDTDQITPLMDTANDPVIRPAVIVEPNNGNFVVFDAVNPQTRTYSHVVTNTGDIADSYDLLAFSELGFLNPADGWVVELIDPATGTVIATDTDFTNGTWDGATMVNTGTLLPGESLALDVRVTVPAGTPEGTRETTTLTAVSDLRPTIEAFATDETTVVDSVGPIVLVSDQSGIIAAGGSIAYSHRVFNNTGSSDTFDLTAFPSEPGWTSTIYNDSNGDGVYTPGIDVAINNTLLLPDGGDQLFFVVVDAPGGALPGDTDVTSITAISRNDPNLFDAVTDTTTVGAASTHDLSGGDTLLVDTADDCGVGNDCPVFPGTLKSLAGDDRYDFNITPSPFFGLDGLDHPTELWIDTTGNGEPDLLIAEDTNGDGTWDNIPDAVTYDQNNDGEPDVFVAAGDELAYELRRPVDPLQEAYRDPVTLSATSQATGERDSVTATNILQAPTHALLTRFEVRSVGGKAVVEWDTSFEHASAGFIVQRRGNGSFERLHQGLVQASGDAPAGATYRWVDNSAATGKTYTYSLVEVDRNAKRRYLGKVSTTIGTGSSAAGESLPAGGFSRELRQPFAARFVLPSGGPQHGQVTPSSHLRIRVPEEGLYFVSAADLAAGFGATEPEVQAWIGDGLLQLDRGAIPPELPCDPTPPVGSQVFVDGFESGNLCSWSAAFGVASMSPDIAWLAAPGNSGIYFYGRAIDSIYTEDNVYWIEHAPGSQMTAVSGGNPSPALGQHFVDAPHFEEDGPFAATSAVEDPDSDFWFWDFVNVTPGAGVSIDSFQVSVDTPGRVSSASLATMQVALQAETSDPDIGSDHSVEIRVNGSHVGSSSWDGSTAHQVQLTFPQTLLLDGANTVEIKTPLSSGIESEIFYLNSIEISYQRRFVAVDDQLTATADGHSTLSLEGFTRSDIVVFDITSPVAVRTVGNVNVENLGGSFRFSLNTASGNARYAALPLSEALIPTLESDLPSDLVATSNGAQYLVIAAAGLEQPADTLASYRQGSGVTTMRVRLQDIYDEFNHGVVSPWAIRDFLTYATLNWQTAPQYVVLAGDSSFDFKDHLGFGGNLLPSPMVRTPEGLFPSDHRIVDLVGNDGVPEVAVGRIPVREASELTAYVDKLSAYESSNGAWRDQTVFVADAADEGGDFAADSDWLIPGMPSDLDTSRIYVDELGGPAARQALLDSINDGARMVHFLGHGGLTQMGDDAGLLLSSDVPTLTNEERQPVLVAMTCALGRFDRIVLDTLSESLVLAEDGGVIALWSPTAFSFNDEAMLNAEGFLSSAFGGDPKALGDAVREGLTAYLQGAEEPRTHLPFVYTLLGDPLIGLYP